MSYLRMIPVIAGGNGPCKKSVDEAIDYGCNLSQARQILIRIAGGLYNQGIEATNPQGKTFSLEGGWDTDFNGHSGVDTILEHGIRVDNGRISVKNLLIR